MRVKRHSVQRSPVPRQRTWDERLWPALLAVWGLTLYVILLLYRAMDDGSVAGARRAIATGLLVVAFAAVVSLALPCVSPRRLRRGLVVALCLSLMLNLSFVVALSHVRLSPPRQDIVARSPPAEPPPTRTLEEYYPLALDGDDRPRQQEQRPVSTGEPELTARDLVRRTRVALPEPLPLQVDAVPPTPQLPMTVAMRREQFVESAPRRAEWEGTLSRQPLTEQPALHSGVQAPPQVPRQSQESLPRAASSDVARRLEREPLPPVTEDANANPPDPRPGAADRSARSISRQIDVALPELLPRLPPLAAARTEAAQFDRPERSPPIEVDPLTQRRSSPNDADGPPLADRPQSAAVSLRPTERLAGLPPLPERPASEARDATSPPRRELGPAAQLPVESPGHSRLASQPSFDLAHILTGSAAPRMASPINRPDPSIPSPRRTVTGQSRAVNSEVDVPHVPASNVAESTGLVPAETDQPTSQQLPGQANLPELVSQAGTVPVELGSRPRVLQTPLPRVQEGGSPQVLRAAAERLTTGRTAGGDPAPALPTDVEQPELAAPARPADLPTAAALSNVRPPRSQAARGEVADRQDAATPARSTATLAAPVGQRRGRVSPEPDLPDSMRRMDMPARRADLAGSSAPAVGPLALPSPKDLGGADEPQGTAAAAAAAAAAPAVSPAAEAGHVARDAAGSLQVDVEAHEAAGGLSSEISSDIGLLNRQAQPESDLIADSVGRFRRQPVGGPLSVNSEVAIPARAYESRLNRRGDLPAGGNGRPSRRTEEAIELGLLYLAEQQRADGSWSLTEAGEQTVGTASEPLTIRSDAAATGLALLSFLGAGYHHRSEKYGSVVNRGLEYLLSKQRRDGDLYVRADALSNQSAWLYSHAIASIALCEAFGMTQDPALREPAQRAIDFIVEAQHPRRGGWRYAPGVGSDTSVSGWMVMALRSAELANLAVPVDTWQRVEIWLEMAQAASDQPEFFRYNPLAPNTVTQGHGRRPTKTMTAVGLLMRMYTGWRRDDLQMKAGADYLLNNLPELGNPGDPQRDTYYWYYATQVMFHMRGVYWERWNSQLHELLTSTQQQTGPLAGSWDPWFPLPDRWASQAGRLYVTTMNLLSLEVYYRHLPIYEDTAR